MNQRSTRLLVINYDRTSLLNIVAVVVILVCVCFNVYTHFSPKKIITQNTHVILTKDGAVEVPESIVAEVISKIRKRQSI